MTDEVMGLTEPKEILIGATALGSGNPATIALIWRALLAPFAVWVIMIAYQSGYGTR